MISVLVTLFLIFGAYLFFGDGETTPAWICIGLIGLVWFLHASSVKDIEAWYNRREYWANGGPNGNHKRGNVVQRVERTQEVEDAERVVVRKEVKPEVREVRVEVREKREGPDDGMDELLAAMAKRDAVRRGMQKNGVDNGNTGVMGGYYRK